MTGLAGIRGRLPHRYPMLLVDRVGVVVPGERLTAYKAVTANEFWFRDTPGPYPPVLLIESWCQAAGLLVTWERPNPDVLTGEVMLFGAISDLRLTGTVRPGDLVEHRVVLEREIGGSAVVTGQSVVDGRVVLAADRVVMATRPAGDLRPMAATGPTETRS